MLKQAKERIGTAGLIVAIIALVVALGGGAYAASGGGGKAQSSKTVAKKGPRGPRGPAGKPGAPGAQGPQGTQGPAGANGKDGANGQSGTAGKDGKSVVLKSANGVTECPDVGGTIVEVKEEPGSAKNVCNGKQGEQGPPGDPWSVDGTLPAGATETGAWAVGGTESTPTLYAPISFTVPLGPGMFSGPSAEVQSHFQTQSDFADFCSGSVSAPSAKPGELCVYATTGFGSTLKNVTFEAIGGPDSPFSGTPRESGAIVRFAFSGAAGEAAFGFGSWAVTGCDPATTGEPDSCPA